jgi:type IX secretion system PorP/SprF family membrane protein
MAGKFLIPFFILASVCLHDTFAQDPEFSQFYANPLYLNPALAGANICPRLIGNYRNQWPSVGNAFVTYNASYDQYVNLIHGGVGVMLTADRAGGGNLNTTAASLTYAYKFKMTDHLYASAGVQGGYYQRSLDWADLRFEDMIDPQNGFVLPTTEKAPDNDRVGVLDLSAGVMVWLDEIFYGGIAVSHLTQPKIGFYTDNDSRLYMKYTVHAGSVINLGSGGFDEEKEFSISPNILYQQQFKYHQLNLGVYLTFNFIIAGLWYRLNFENSDAVITLVGIHYRSFQAGYSYDWTVSRLGLGSGGAHEVSVAWQFPCSEKRRHIKAIKCPRF